MEEWKECKLEDICDVRDGTHDTPKQTTDGKYLVTSKHIKGGRIDLSSAYKISLEDFDFINRRSKVDQWDILISMIGTVGEICLISEQPDFAIKNVGLIKTENEDLAKYLYYYLKSPEAQNNISARLKGTTQQYLSLGEIRQFPIKLPPLPTQQKIAAILSSLDDKIELNNKINTNLEQQAQALFKNWFVDFEPFGGKMPEGWKETDIYSIANIIYGSPFASKLFNTEKNGKPIIRIRDLKDQHSDVYTPEERDDAYLIQPKDIVVGMDGEFRPYIWGSEPGWLNQRVSVFENKRPKGNAFLYFSIKPLLDVVEKTQVATTVIHIGKKDFDKFQITLPTEDILDKFDELTDPILDQIVANKLENRRLAELRDTLLPKLMNGEIEV